MTSSREPRRKHRKALLGMMMDDFFVSDSVLE